MTRKLMVLALVAFGTVGFSACGSDDPTDTTDSTDSTDSTDDTDTDA